MKRNVIITAAAVVVAGAIGIVIAVNRSSGWDEPADYTYRVMYSPLSAEAGRYDITVKDHAVVSVTSLQKSNFAVEQGWISVGTVWTLADLEAMVKDTKALPHGSASITYDATTGAPSTVFIDKDVNVLGNEQPFQVLAFDPAN
jgi:hypothetical protein